MAARRLIRLREAPPCEHLGVSPETIQPIKW